MMTKNCDPARLPPLLRFILRKQPLKTNLLTIQSY